MTIFAYRTEQTVFDQFYFVKKIVSEYDLEIPQSKTANKPVAS